VQLKKSDKIFVAGYLGMVGSAFMRRLGAEGFTNLLKPDRSQLDLMDEHAVLPFFLEKKPDVVILAAAKVGGIQANNDYPVEFLLENLRIQNNVIRSADQSGVRKLLFLGSSCIYPKFAPQPIPESALLTGPLEPTNEAYAIAKIAGIKLCQAYRQEQGRDFISAQPTNLYGPGDNYDLETSHVLPDLIRKAHEAKVNRAESLTIWGSGTPLREFLHVDDLADAVIFLLRNYSGPVPINIGSGEELSIAELARLVSKTIGFDGSLTFDTTRPDGTPRKLADLRRLRELGWNNARPLTAGLKQTYQSFLDRREN